MSAAPVFEVRAGTLQVRLAATPEEIAASQQLRHRVFVEEMGASPSVGGLAGHDHDAFDTACDHLIVLENASGTPQVVGSYRLLRREPMQKVGRFYSADEFDLTAVERFDGEVMELGRSCVDARYRSRAVMQLLWRGIGAYVSHYKIGLMFGCASLHGADASLHREALAYLHHYHLAPPALRLRALDTRFTPMDTLPVEALNARARFAALPALVKGYLRLGGFVGEGAVVDTDYNTVDVGIVVQTDLVNERYAQRYGTMEAE